MSQIQPILHNPVPPGRYVLAVSGGVDSMVLLDMLRRQPELELIVAHFNHGIRPDSHQDEALVRATAEGLGMVFVSAEGHLGPAVSEEAARQARYAFLHQVREQQIAQAIITAHHQDDVLETIMINLHRGTGWRGLAALRSSEVVLRPLLNVPKADLLRYAQTYGVQWREDTTNQDHRYLRNVMRQRLVGLQPEVRQKILALWRRQQVLLRQMSAEVDAQNLAFGMQRADGAVSTPRYPLIMTPAEVGLELVQHLVRSLHGTGLQRPQARQLLLFAKVAKPGKIYQFSRDWQARVTTQELIVEPRGNMVS